MDILEKYENLHIPEYALCYIEYGNSSKLSSKAKGEIDAYLLQFYLEAEQLGAQVIFMPNTDFTQFSRFPEFGKPCEVRVCTIVLIK